MVTVMRGHFQLIGIYLFALQMRMNDLTSADPVFMVFGTPGSSVAALDSAALPWVEQHLIVPGDYNGNGTVDAADYVVWRKGGPLQYEVVTPNVATEEDYAEWRARFGNPVIAAASGLAAGHEVPEPVAWPMFLVLIGGRFASRWPNPRRVGSDTPPALAERVKLLR